ncbi:hypothetical protein [Oceanobacillus senegalensis]|uniref:hypothetical protein n=1 Tax=Oceanobacillus senegalensis TaxID=1936063 RepID=UPI001C4F896C|nr:hypothetical protein [Oceanobacillus senegalensis]
MYFYLCWLCPWLHITEEEIDKYIDDFIKEKSEVQTMVLPLLANITIRSGLSYLARISAGAIIRVGSHTTYRAVQRSITSRNLDDALSYGERYTDIYTGARIAFDKSKGVAVVVDKTNNKTITTYPILLAKYRWQRSFWSW